MTAPPLTRRLAPAVLALVAALAIGCGDDSREEGGVPRDEARALLDSLDQADQQFNKDCGELEESTVPAIQEQVQELPTTVDPELRRALDESVAELPELARDCEEPEPETTPIEPVPTEPIEPTTPPAVTPTEPEVETKTKEETETEEEEPAEEEKPEPDKVPKPKPEPGGGGGAGDDSGLGQGRGSFKTDGAAAEEGTAG